MAHLAGSDVRCVLWLSLFFFPAAAHRGVLVRQADLVPPPPPPRHRRESLLSRLVKSLRRLWTR